MNDSFETTIRRLWASLRMQEPRIDERRSVTLSVDRVDLTLAETEDERAVLVTGRVGRLANDPVERERQVRRVLGLSLGLMQGNSAAICLDRSGSETPAVLAQVRHDYDGGRIDLLTRRIEDVLQAVEIIGPELASSGTRAAPRQEPTAAYAVDSIVFRP